MYSIIVNRYNENVDWLNSFDRGSVYLYDKSPNPISWAIPRENIGREAESFLFHIIEHYHSLPEYLIFLQGDPFDHCSCTPYTIKEMVEKAVRLGVTYPFYPKEAHYIITERHNQFTSIHCKKEYKRLFGTELPGDTVTYGAGAQYIVTRETILSRSKQFYINLRQLVINSNHLGFQESHNTGLEFNDRFITPWTLERMFWYIFDKNISSNPDMLLPLPNKCS